MGTRDQVTEAGEAQDIRVQEGMEEPELADSSIYGFYYSLQISPFLFTSFAFAVLFLERMCLLC